MKMDVTDKDRRAKLKVTAENTNLLFLRFFQLPESE